MKRFIFTTLLVTLFSNSLNAYDSTTYGGNNQYYNSQENDYSNNRGGNDSNYNAADNSRGEIYGDSNSYSGSNGMIYNK